jgi:hypothetical protein
MGSQFTIYASQTTSRINLGSREKFLAGLGGGVAAHDILGNLEYLAGEQYLPMTVGFQNLSNSSAEYRSFGGEAVTATNDVLSGYPCPVLRIG